MQFMNSPADSRRRSASGSPSRCFDVRRAVALAALVLLPHVPRRDAHARRARHGHLRKSFTLSNAARQTATVGEIVNHQSDDVKKLYDLIPYLHLVWSSPLQIAIALYMLGDLLGWAALGGVGVLAVLFRSTRSSPRSRPRSRRTR
jgi:hypothetical protein